MWFVHWVKTHHIAGNKSQQTIHPWIHGGFPLIDMLLIDGFRDGFGQEPVSFDGRKNNGKIRRAPARLVLVGNVVLEKGPKQARLKSNVVDVVEVVEERHWRGRIGEARGLERVLKVFNPGSGPGRSVGGLDRLIKPVSDQFQASRLAQQPIGFGHQDVCNFVLTK